MLSHFSGNGLDGLVDGPPGAFNASEFYQPEGIAVDAQGNAFIADTSNCRIRKIDTLGVSMTFAGNGNCSLQDGSGGPDGTASFGYPNAVVLDGQGNLLVADSYPSRVRKIDASGNVTTVAGSGFYGYVDGPAATAQFAEPGGLALDNQGNLYVADQGNFVVRKIDTAGNVTTYAGNGTEGFVDGPAASAEFNNFRGIAVDRQGNVYVADEGNNRIRKIDTNGNVSTFAGNGTEGLVDGTGGPTGTAEFALLGGMNIDSAGTLYVTDTMCIRAISPSGNVTTVAGTPNRQGNNDGPAGTGYLEVPSDVAVDAQGNLYISQADSVIRKADPSGTLTTLGGNGAPGWFDGNHSHDGSAEFYMPYAVALDGLGNLFVSDFGNYAIRKLDSSGSATTFIGQGVSDPSRSFTVGQTSGVAVDAQGNLYVANTDYGTIIKVDAAGNPSTLAGGNPNSNFADGQGAAAGFYYPSGLGVDAQGNVYVIDAYNDAVRKIDPSGNVTTLAGTGTAGHQDGPGSSAEFEFAIGSQLVVDAQGNLYVADTYADDIRKIDPSGNVTTFAGTGSSGSDDGTLSTATFNQPTGIAIDGQGNLYVADSSGNRIRMIDTAGNVTTIAGGGEVSHGTYLDGSSPDNRLNNPVGLAVDALGTIYIADANNNVIRTLTYVP